MCLSQIGEVTTEAMHPVDSKLSQLFSFIYLIHGLYSGDPSGYGYRTDIDPSSSLAGTLYVLDDRDPRCLVLGVMEDFVGGIVGRNGATISEIQSVSVNVFCFRIPLPFLVSKMSRTHIQISDKDEYIQGTRDRKLTIKGEVESVRVAYHHICSKVSYVHIGRNSWDSLSGIFDTIEPVITDI